MHFIITCAMVDLMDYYIPSDHSSHINTEEGCEAQYARRKRKEATNVKREGARELWFYFLDQ